MNELERYLRFQLSITACRDCPAVICEGRMKCDVITKMMDELMHNGEFMQQLINKEKQL